MLVAMKVLPQPPVAELTVKTLAWVGTAGATGSGVTPGGRLGGDADQAAAADVEGPLEGDHEVVVVEGEPEDVVGAGLDDLPEAGVGPVGEGQDDRGGGAVLVEGGQAAQPGTAGQRRAGEEDGERAPAGAARR